MKNLTSDNRIEFIRLTSKVVHEWKFHLEIFSHNEGAACKVVPHWWQKTKTHHCFIIISHSFTVRISNQLALRVRRASLL